MVLGPGWVDKIQPGWGLLTSTVPRVALTAQIRRAEEEASEADASRTVSSCIKEQGDGRSQEQDRSSRQSKFSTFNILYEGKGRGGD